MKELLIYLFITVIVPLIALWRNSLESKVDFGHNIENEQVD